MAKLSLMRHFQSFAGGLIDTADIAYFVLFIITFLTLTIRRLDADRLRG
jgi:ABC-2 type transport system permease protein